MQIDLDEPAAELLRELLDSALRDLNYEIANTDNHTFREQLRTRRDHLRAVLDQVGGPLPNA